MTGLLSDNGSSYIADDLAVWLKAQGMVHVCGAPNHPQTQGKIERWHQTLKNRVLLENYYLPGFLEAGVGAFVEHDNHRRYHESLGNLTPADVYFGQHHAIIERRRKIQDTNHPKNAAWPITGKPLNINQDEPEPPLNDRLRCPIHSDDGHGQHHKCLCLCDRPPDVPADGYMR